jgi:error-prone DNA polymerase
MGFWSPSVIVHDARRHRIRVLPVDLHASDAQTTTVDDGTIRLGLSTVRGMGETALARLLTARQQAPFRSLADLCKRAPLPMRTLEYLIQAGALNSFDASRRKLLWELGKLHLEFALPLESHEEVELPTLSQVDLMRMEHLALGLSTGEHLMTLLREWATKRGILHSASLHQTRDGAIIFCAGLVVVQQAPPTAKGFRFLTLEDEFGFINVIVKPAIYEQYQRVIRDNPLLLVEGEVQRQQGVIHVLARRLQAATFQTRYQ